MTPEELIARRRLQWAEAQRRWRKRHPEKTRELKRAYDQREDVKARKAAAMRAYRARKKAAKEV